MSFRSVALLVLLTSCAHGVNMFPLASPMWDDAEDRRPFSPMPEEYFSPFAWDGADQMFFRPLARFFAVDPAGEAVNVNSMDEVPDSSWFTNRLSRHDLTTSEIVGAACSEPPLDPAGPWTIVAAKPNGANPGFIIEDAGQRRFLLKFDGRRDPERATAADVIGSILYWAAGFNTPCNRVVYFNKEVLQIGDGVTVEILGEERQLTWADLDPVFELATQTADGRFRGAASRFLPGRPIGPWRYEGTQDDDPNDVVDHEDRRELRGAYVLSAWLNHFDAREQNSLSIWREGEGETGYVEHYYIDFGEIFGSMWTIEGISRRLGHSSYFDMRHVWADFFTFGLIDRPWNHARLGAAGTVLGYYDSERFEPDAWHPGYPNPAFMRASERDKAWMTRIIAKLSASDVRAVLDEGSFENAIADRELYRIVMQRRRKILERYFRVLSPLAEPRVVGNKLCLRDLAVESGVIAAEERPYYTSAWVVESGNARDLESGVLSRRYPSTVCATLPVVQVDEGVPRYLIVDVVGTYTGLDDRAMPARTHLYRLPDGSYRIVGLERPDSRAAPGE